VCPPSPPPCLCRRAAFFAEFAVSWLSFRLVNHVTAGCDVSQSVAAHRNTCTTSSRTPSFAVSSASSLIWFVISLSGSQIAGNYGYRPDRDRRVSVVVVVVVVVVARGLNVSDVRQPKLGRNMCHRGISRQLFISRLPVLSASYVPIWRRCWYRLVCIYLHRYCCNPTVSSSELLRSIELRLLTWTVELIACILGPVWCFGLPVSDRSITHGWVTTETSVCWRWSHATG